jgi:hypothetical protein
MGFFSRQAWLKGASFLRISTAFLLIRLEVLPPGLLASLGAVESLSPACLNLPFRREGGQFELRQ